MSADRSGEAVFGLIDDVGRLTEAADIDAFLRRIVDVYGLRNVAYCGRNIAAATPFKPYLAVTYPAAWVEHYLAQNYFTSDPVLASGYASVLPLDWRGLDRKPPRVRRLFGEASEFGIGRQGLTFPVRGRSGDSALFTVTGDQPDRDWDALLRSVARDLQILAVHVHQSVLRANGNLSRHIALSPREIQCLQWVAVGKTVSETATILALSTRTVRFYLDIARHKMGTTNITHAVGCAVGLGLISAPTPQPLPPDLR